jgi:hypothetical protein
MLHKRFDFTQDGGFPLTQEVLNYIQQSYTEALQAATMFLGDNFILTGAAFNGTAFTNGWVVYNGEILPFVGGSGSFSGSPISQIISVFEAPTNLIFADNTAKPVQIYRYVSLGNGGENAKTIGGLMGIPTYKKFSQILFKSGVIDLTAGSGAINISLGQNIDVTKLNPVVSMQGWNSASPDKKTVFSVQNISFTKGSVQLGSLFFLTVQPNFTNIDINLNTFKLIYHIFKDTTGL